MSVACTSNQNDTEHHTDHEEMMGNDHADNMSQSQEKAMHPTNSDSMNSSEEEGMITSYMKLKDALVDDDPDAAREAAGHMMEHSNMGGLDIIASSNDIEIQREAFGDLSVHMYDMLKNNGHYHELYWNYCPMMGKEGAYWLSRTEEIRNPYMGHGMMKCGSVKERL